MMTVGAFLRSSSLLIAIMAALAIVETVLPFSRKDWRKRHALPNLLLSAVTLLLNFVFNAGAVLVTSMLSVRHFGVLSADRISPVTGIALSVIALDACTYIGHRLMHVIPALWRAHSVHHADPLVDVTTALRFHPIETAWRVMLIMGPSWLLGLPAEGLVAYRIIAAFVALYEHMNVRLWQPLDTALSFVLGTPNMHKIHHSRMESETNTNFGNIFSIFDRVLGTFTPSARAVSVDYGLDGYDDLEAQRFAALLRAPFRHESSSAARVHPSERCAVALEAAHVARRPGSAGDRHREPSRVDRVRP